MQVIGAVLAGVGTAGTIVATRTIQLPFDERAQLSLRQEQVHIFTDEGTPLMRERAQQTQPGMWVEGFFFDDTKLKDKRELNVHDLDEVSAQVAEHEGGYTPFTVDVTDDGIKILGDGALTKPLVVHAAKFSESAAAKIAAELSGAPRKALYGSD